MAEVGSAAVAIFPSFKNFRSKVNNEVEASGAEGGKKFGGAFKGAMGVLAGVFAADKIITGFSSAIKSAGELEQSAGAIQAVFKGSASDMLKWSTEASNAVGLTQNEFNELGTVIGAQLKNGGTAMDQLAPKTNQLIGLGADLSSMFGGTSREAVEALSSALKGERDPIEKYGVSLNQAKIDAEAAALGFSKVGGSFDTQAQQAATLSLIMKQTTDAQGNFAKEGETLAGQQQRMSAGWKDISASIGGLFLPVMTSAFGFINSNVLPIIDTFVNRLGEGGIGGAFAPIAAVAGPILSTLAAQFAPLIPQVIGLVSAFSPMGLILQIITPLLPQISGMFTVLTGVISSVLAQVLPLATTLVSQLVPIIVQLVATVLPPLVAMFGQLIAAIAPLVAQIMTVLIPIIQALMPVVVTVFTVIASVITAAMQIVQGIIQVVTGIISGNWSQVWEGIGNIFGGIWNTIVALVSGAIGIVWSVIQAGLGIVFGIVEDVLGNVGDFFADTWNNVTRGISDFVGGIGKFFEEIPGNVQNALSGAASWLYNSGRDIVNGLFDGIKSLAGTIGNFFLGLLPGWIVEPFKIALGIRSPSRVFAGFGKNIGQGLINGIDGMNGKIESSVKGMVTVPPVPSLAVGAVGAVGGAAGVGGAGSVNFTINQVDDPIGTATAVARRLRAVSV